MKWLEIKAQNNIGEIYIYGEIETEQWWDSDVTPTGITEELNKLQGVGHINLYVNSPGGSVSAGIAIYNKLKRCNKPITAYVDGVAASIASLIVLAADEVVMPYNSFLMIHNPWVSGVSGEAKDLREIADRLDKNKGIILQVYQDKTGIEENELSKMMDDETWITGTEALDMGFADEMDEEQKIAACYSGKNVKFKNVEVDLDKFTKFPKDKFVVHEEAPKNTKLNSHRLRIAALSA